MKKFSPESEFFFDEGCHIIELHNDPDDPKMSIARSRVEVGRTTRWHRLAEITERYVILEGQGRVETGELPATDVSTGDIVVIPPGCPQRISNSGSSDLIFLALCTPRFTMESYEDLQDHVM